MTERNGSKLEAIHEHAVKTNGRVTKLEKTTLVLLSSLGVLLAANPAGLLEVLKLISSWFR